MTMDKSVDTFGRFASKLTGAVKVVVRGDPVWDTLDGRRYRFARMVDSTSVELMTDDGKPLPDYRHPSQVFAY
jgi:hypothetical protein